MSNAFEKEPEPPATEAQLAAALLALRDILAEHQADRDQLRRMVTALRLQVEALRAEVAELQLEVERRRGRRRG